MIILLMPKMKLFRILVQLLLMQGVVTGNTTTNIRGLLDVQRNAQEGIGDSITGFSIYNNATNQFNLMNSIYFYGYGDFYKARILLDQYPSSKINIIVNTISSPSKPIQCVKIKFGDFQTTYEKTPPYALYGDDPVTGVMNVMKPRKTGIQILEAWTYSDSNCLGEEASYKRVDVQLVPKTIVPAYVGPIHVSYNGTIASSATTQQTAAMVKATCAYIGFYFRYRFVYRSTLSLEKISCWRVNNTITNNNTNTNTTMIASTTPLSITYKVIPSFRMNALYWANNVNPFPPSSTKILESRVLSSLTDLFSDKSLFGQEFYWDNYSDGPLYNEKMSQYVKRGIRPSSPYYPFTNMIV